MRRRALICVIAFSFSIMFTGCGRPVNIVDVPGTYVAQYPFATESVTINDNGKFNQTIKVKATGKVAKTNGTWRFDTKDGDIYLSKEFMVVVNGFGEMITNFDTPTREAISILPVRRSFGKMQIGTDPGIPYHKLPK